MEGILKGGPMFRETFCDGFGDQVGFYISFTYKLGLDPRFCANQGADVFERYNDPKSTVRYGANHETAGTGSNVMACEKTIRFDQSVSGGFGGSYVDVVPKTLSPVRMLPRVSSRVLLYFCGPLGFCLPHCSCIIGGLTSICRPSSHTVSPPVIFVILLSTRLLLHLRSSTLWWPNETLLWLMAAMPSSSMAYEELGWWGVDTAPFPKPNVVCSKNGCREWRWALDQTFWDARNPSRIANARSVHLC